MRTFFYSLLILLTTTLPALSVNSNSQSGESGNYGFWENKGQVVDQNGVSRKDILYIFEQDGFTIALGKDFFSYQLVSIVQDSGKSLDKTGPIIRDEDGAPTGLKQHTFQYERTDIRLLGANKNAVCIGSGISKETRNYFTPAGKFLGVHHFQSVTYENVYPGINLVFYVRPLAGTDKSRLKYDFILQPGADIRRIQLAYAGSALPAVNEAGELISLFPSSATVAESVPLSYYASSADSFIIPYFSTGSIISFKTTRQLKKETLTIDPEITWSRYYGGVKDEIIEMVEADGLGNIYACGQTFSPSGIVTSGAYQAIKKGISDCFITKMTQAGSIEWSTYFGGEADEFALGMCLDGFGNLFICGQTKSQQVMSTTGVYQETNHGLIDAFISKFDTSGNLIWSSFYGGSQKDQAYSCIADQTGVYLCGYTESADNIATSGADQTVYAGAGDAFICGFSMSGNILFSTYLGGSDQDRGHDIHMDHFGFLLVSGTTPSADGIASGDVHQTEVGGNNDVFIGKYTKSGVKKWCTYYGGLKTERGREIVPDGSGNMYITGPTASGLYMTTAGVYQTQLNGSGPASSTVYEDAYLAKLDSTGHLVWGTYFGGSGDEIGSCIKLMNNGLIVIGGTTLSDSLISTPDAFQPLISGKRDAFLAVFSDQGQLLWSTYYGGTEEEIFDDGYGPALDVYNNDQLIFGLSTQSPGLGTLNAYTPSNNATPTTDALFVNIDLGCLDKYEPNNKIEMSYSLGVIAQPVSMDGLVNYAGDKDYFSFTKTSDLPLKIYLSNLAKNYDIILYDSLFHPVKVSHHAGLGDEEITINKLIKGKFYVAVLNPGGEYSATCYHLTIKKLTGLNKSTGEIENEVVAQQLFFYPNPATTTVNISIYAMDDEPAVICIADISGRKLMEQTVSLVKGENNVPIQIGQLHSGTYLVSVISSNFAIGKLIVSGDH